MSEKRKKRIATLLIALVVAAMAAVTCLVGVPMARFAREPQAFRDWVEAKGAWGQLLFVGMVLFQVLVALIPGEPLEIAAGYAFGAVEGTLLCLLGSTLGGILVFLLVRRWGARVLELYFPREKIQSLGFLQNTPKLRAAAFFLMFLPGTPKDLISYFMGLTKMKLSEWVILSAVARIPSIVTSTVGGNALGGQDYRFAVLVFALTLAVSLLGGLVYKAYTRHHGEKDRQEGGALSHPSGERQKPDKGG